MSDRGSPAGHLAMVGSVSVYAIGLVVQKQLALTVPFAQIAFWQFGIAAMVLWTLSLATSPGLKLKPLHLIAGLVWGMIAPGASLMINMIGARSTDGVTMMMIWGLLPLVAPLIGPIVIGERFRPIIVFSAIIAIGGVWVGVGDRMALGWSAIEGTPLVGLAVVMAGCGFVLGRWLNRGDVSWHRFAALQVTGAALVALPEDLRARYAEHMVALTEGAPQFLISFDYDQSEMNGPPFSVVESEVRALYSAHYDISLTASADVPGRLKGVAEAQEMVWFLR